MTTQTPMKMTHDAWTDLYADFRCIIQGRKYIVDYDADGRLWWTPVHIISKDEVLKGVGA